MALASTRIFCPFLNLFFAFLTLFGGFQYPSSVQIVNGSPFRNWFTLFILKNTFLHRSTLFISVLKTIKSYQNFSFNVIRLQNGCKMQKISTLSYYQPVFFTSVSYLMLNFPIIIRKSHKYHNKLLNTSQFVFGILQKILI